ncbi:MAG: sigma-70 family RNA polymerase sigma factor [Pseudomonadales bacterium]|nr:sigma-70 family RNA polymerase sigma factor [Pseudomonadales bacterium]
MAAMLNWEAEIAVLYQEHHGWLRNWLTQRLCCPETAAELAQDTFIRVLRQRPCEELRQPRAYLGRIARNLMVDLIRRRRHEQAYVDSLTLQPPVFERSPETRESLIETLVAIDSRLGELGTRTREIFRLSRLEGMNYVAISGQLRVSVNTVRKHVTHTVDGFLPLLEA